MIIGSIDKPQRTAARVAGLAYLISFFTVIAVNFGVFARLIIRGNPMETARNILANETLFRIGVAGDILYCVGVVVLLTALYVILKPVSQNLSLVVLTRRYHGRPGEQHAAFGPCPPICCKGKPCCARAR